MPTLGLGLSVPRTTTFGPGGSGPAIGDGLLLESGDFLLLESSAFILLE